MKHLVGLSKKTNGETQNSLWINTKKLSNLENVNKFAQYLEQTFQPMKGDSTPECKTSRKKKVKFYQILQKKEQMK